LIEHKLIKTISINALKSALTVIKFGITMIRLIAHFASRINKKYNNRSNNIG